MNLIPWVAHKTKQARRPRVGSTTIQRPPPWELGMVAPHGVAYPRIRTTYSTHRYSSWNVKQEQYKAEENGGMTNAWLRGLYHRVHVGVRPPERYSSRGCATAAQTPVHTGNINASYLAACHELLLQPGSDQPQRNIRPQFRGGVVQLGGCPAVHVALHVRVGKHHLFQFYRRHDSTAKHEAGYTVSFTTPWMQLAARETGKSNSA